MTPTPLRNHLLAIAICLVAASTLRAEIPPMSDEQRTAKADHIVLAVPISTSVEERRDENYIYRQMTFEIRVEEAEKGSPVRGDVITVTAWKNEWIGEGRPFANASGHRPLPIEGGLARFHLQDPDENGHYAILLPNGVEPGSTSSPPEVAEAGASTSATDTAADDADQDAPSTKDPFGWDVILVLLAIPLLVGSFRQSGTPRWMLMSIATIMLVSALVVALLG